MKLDGGAAGAAERKSGGEITEDGLDDRSVAEIAIGVKEIVGGRGRNSGCQRHGDIGKGWRLGK